MLNKKIIFNWNKTFSMFRPSGCFSDENIRYRPKQGYGIIALASWLSSDLQCSINSVNIWINNLIDLENSPAPDGMFGVGNAFWVLITDDYIFIGTEYSEEQQILINKEQLLYVLEQYKAFLEGDYKDPDNPPDPIDVEFIAEGQEAINIYNGLPNSHLVPYAC